MGLRLVKVDEYIGRGTDIKGVFVVDDEGWAWIEDWCSKRKEVYFGEIAGKHSEVRVTFDLKDFKVVSEDQDFIEKFVEIIGRSVGINVLAYMYDRCNDCGEEMDCDGEVCSYCQGDNEDEDPPHEVS